LNRLLIQLLLDLVEVNSEECKSGAYLATLLIQTIEDYNLTAQLGWITSDNIGVNNTLIHAIECFIHANGYTHWQEKICRLRYIGHIINLATQAFMFSVDVEAAEIAYSRADLSQLNDSTDTASYSGSSYNIAEHALAKHLAASKLRNLAMALRDNKYYQAFKKLARGFLECPITVPKIPGKTR